MMAIIGWIILGLIIGALAKFVMPGNQNMGWLMTIILGIVGSIVGGFLAGLMGISQDDNPWDIGSIVISDQFQIPVKYIGVGEKMEDLQLFNGEEFVDSFFKKRK